MCKLNSAQVSTLLGSRSGLLHVLIHLNSRLVCLAAVPDLRRKPALCVLILTYRPSSTNKTDMAASSEKRKALLASGTLNPHPEAVQSALFADGDFFDRRDKAQVKYEMLRVNRVEGVTVTEACRQFGFSRESFYQIRDAFRSHGFHSFLPAKRGRKGPSKLKGEALEFALARSQQEPQIDPGQLAELIAQRYGIEVHRTTVQRARKNKTARAGDTTAAIPSGAAPVTTQYRRSMNKFAPKPWRIASRPAGSMNGCVTMVWQACVRVLRSSAPFSLLSTAPRVHPGAAGGICNGSDFAKPMTSLPGR